MSFKRVFILSIFLLSACGSKSPTGISQNISIQYTPATAGVISDLLACASSSEVSAVIQPTDFLNYQSVDMVIRVGEPPNLANPAFQIGTENILVIANQENPITTLTSDQVRSVFMGRKQKWSELEGNDSAIQIWVFPSSEDIQILFNETILQGSPVTPTARVATSMADMVQAITSDVNAIGILPDNWKRDGIVTVFDVGAFPVLAITSTQPEALLSTIITCMQ